MARPGFSLEVDAKTPPLMTMAGSQLRLERFGLGTRVVYGPDADRSTDPVALIDASLQSPLRSAPLDTMLRPSTKLTLVILDTDAPLPLPYFDPRRTLTERVLEQAARAGVDDVEIVVANGLQQRWSAARINRVLGSRVATSFLPDGLITSHDVTAEDLVPIGEVDGHQVSINARIAASDLLCVIGLRADHEQHHPLSEGITDLATLRRLGGGQEPEFAGKVAKLIGAQVPLFTLIAVLGQPLLSPALRFASRREWEWSSLDRLAFVAARQTVAAMPRQGAQVLHGKTRADYAIVDVVGGEHASVLEDSRLVWRAANSVEVPGAADVLVTSVWGGAIDEADPIGNPLAAARRALVTQAGSHLGTPFVREGGAVLAMHPLRQRFSNRRQSAAADFFATVLPETTDPAEIAERFEPAALADEWYLDLYRKHFAPHPLQVFQDWYAISEATGQLGDVIWVGGDRHVSAVMGHRAASTMADALEIASASVGVQPSITVLRGAGLVLGDVK